MADPPAQMEVSDPMLIAALVAFAVLLVAWLVAPADHALRVANATAENPRSAEAEALIEAA